MTTVYYSGTRADVRRVLIQVIQIAAGTGTDTLAVRQAVQYRMGNALLSKIQQAFIVKSRGGTDECGIKWPPLAPSTIRRRLAKTDFAGLQKKVKKAKTKAEREQAKAVMEAALNVDILRDTGLMLRSFSAGVDAAESGAAFQIFVSGPGSVIVGTNRYPWHHLGVAGRLPARNLWPPDGRLPGEWWDAIRGAGVRGFAAVLVMAFSQNYRPAG